MATRNSTTIGLFVITPYPYVLWTLERLIENSQPAMQAVGSGTSSIEALEKTEGLTPDVFVLDANIGREKCLSSISQLKTSSGVKILVLTGRREESMHGDAVLAGANGVVRTDLPAQTILKAINKVYEGELWLDRAMTSLVFEQMIRERMGEAADSDRAKIASLTDRERELVALAAHHVSATGKVLARMLDLSENTVRKHLTSIYDKLNVPGRLAMCAYANQHGLTSSCQTSQESSPSGDGHSHLH